MVRRLFLAAVTALIAVATSFTATLPAQAAENNPVGECLGSDQVWLLVITETQEVIANECVGTPKTGIEALEAANVAITYDKNSMLCTLGGHPSECPAKFNGSYWNYNIGKPGTAYEYAQTGPDESAPAPGTIEAWCYNDPSEQSCTPPQLNIVQDGKQVAPPAGTTAEDLAFTGAAASPSPSASPSQGAENQAPADNATASPWGWIIGGAVAIVVIAVISWLLVSKRKGSNTALGGR